MNSGNHSKLIQQQGQPNPRLGIIPHEMNAQTSHVNGRNSKTIDCGTNFCLDPIAASDLLHTILWFWVTHCAFDVVSTGRQRRCKTHCYQHVPRSGGRTVGKARRLVIRGVDLQELRLRDHGVRHAEGPIDLLSALGDALLEVVSDELGEHVVVKVQTLFRLPRRTHGCDSHGREWVLGSNSRTKRQVIGQARSDSDDLNRRPVASCLMSKCGDGQRGMRYHSTITLQVKMQSTRPIVATTMLHQKRLRWTSCGVHVKFRSRCPKRPS